MVLRLSIDESVDIARIDTIKDKRQYLGKYSTFQTSSAEGVYFVIVMLKI